MGRLPDAVFVFLHPWRNDAHNTPEVESGYQSLLDRWSDTAFPVPPGAADRTTEFVLARAVEVGLVAPR